MDYYILYKHGDMFFVGLGGRESNDVYSYVLRHHDPEFPPLHTKIDNTKVIISTKDRKLALSMRQEVEKLYQSYFVRMENLNIEYYDDIMEMIGVLLKPKNINEYIDFDQLAKIVEFGRVQYSMTDVSILFYGMDAVDAIKLYNYLSTNLELSVEIKLDAADCVSVKATIKEL